MRLKVRSPRHWRQAKRCESDPVVEREADEDAGLGVAVACRLWVVENGEDVAEEEREEAGRDEAASV